MKTHQQLQEESWELEDLVKKYQAENNTQKLEQTLILLIEDYEGLNYCEEDDYLENMVDCYLLLANIYKNDSKKLAQCYEKTIETLDFLIQRDKSEKHLLPKHIAKLNQIFYLFTQLNPNNTLLQEYPRIKNYIKEIKWWAKKV